MNAIIFLEGGGDSRETEARCREGFRSLLEKCGFKGRLPRTFACGGRSAAYDDFSTRHAKNTRGEYVAMWIDSEEPMDDIEKAWAHLAKRDRWKKPKGAADDQVLFMTTCMETYLVADRDALKEHYGSKLHESALPAVSSDLETRSRQDVQDKLVHATRNCSNAYSKGKRSFEVLGKVAPDPLKKHLPSFVRVCRILDAKL